MRRKRKHFCDLQKLKRSWRGTDLERSRDLAMKKVVSSAELDSAQSKFRRMNAVVDQMRSSIAKKTVIAPFDGQLGIRQVNVGQMINAGQQVVGLTALDPVFVDFALPATISLEAGERIWRCTVRYRRVPWPACSKGN